MVERFLFYCTTENQGLHNRKSGFFKYVKYLIFWIAQPKIRVLPNLSQLNNINSCDVK